MNFEFSADQMQLKDIARKFLEKEESVKRARNVWKNQGYEDENLHASARFKLDVNGICANWRCPGHRKSRRRTD